LESKLGCARDNLAAALTMKLHTAVCYLCLDKGNEENGQTLRRNCACRGTDAGFVHLACLAEYAATRSMQAHTTAEFKDLWVE
jgi:hypothetical protein